MPPPTARDIESVWDWNGPPSLQWAKLTNPNIAGRGGMSMLSEWDGNQLLYFIQWRNTGLLGRDADTSHAGPVTLVSPGMSRGFDLDFSFISEF